MLDTISNNAKLKLTANLYSLSLQLNEFSKAIGGGCLYYAGKIISFLKPENAVVSLWTQMSSVYPQCVIV